jgi:hypothetical protein
MPRRDRHKIRRRKKAVAAAARAAAEWIPPADENEPVEIFRAGSRREAWVRFVQLLCILMAPVALWGAHDAAFNPAEILSRHGDVVSWPVRYDTAALLFAVGLVAAVGGIVYGWCYVTRAVWDPVAGQSRLTLAGFVIPVHLDVPEATEPRWSYRTGFSRAGDTVVNAPYYGLHLPGRRLTLIVDCQGMFIRPGLLDRVLMGGGSGLGFVDENEVWEHGGYGYPPPPRLLVVPAARRER